MNKNTLLIVDPSDITKRYAQRMVCLAQVGTGNEKRIGLGYWLNVMVGAEVDSPEIVPWVHGLYSQL